ncbi:MAG TPA: SurA N-terminal domain-containing protein [Gaiellaceae bacterium]
MRRLLVVAAAVGVAVVALAVVAVVRNGGDGDETVQTVAGHEITRDDLELAVEHFHEEADREGRPFPAKGTRGYRSVEKIALGLLIDQAAIQAAAARLGVDVSEAQVRARTAGSGESEEGGDVRVKAEAVVARATARTQLAKEEAARRLTAGLTVPPSAVRAYYQAHRKLYGSTPYVRIAPAIRSQLLAQRRNAVLAGWLTKVRAGEPTPSVP